MSNASLHVTHFIALTLLAATSVLAGPPSSHESRGSERRAVRDVVGEVEHRYRGHVIDVQPPTPSEDMYRVRILQEGGRVKTVRVPAKRERRRD